MISVCAAHWNRHEELARMIEMYSTLYYELVESGQLEISICDDGSTPPIAAGFGIPVPHPGIIFTQLPEKSHALNPCVPINRAVNASTGDIILLTSPEIEHTEPVIGPMLDLLVGPADYVTAQCRDSDGEWLAGPQTRHGTRGRSPVPPGSDFHFCAMFTRQLWEAARGFDEDYRHGQACDDNDWLWRAYGAGAVFKSAPVVVLHHRSRVRWNLPHNRKLLARKWPEARRARGHSR